jgi:hypothetical protein
MTDKLSRLNKIRSEAAECLLVSTLSTGDKGRMFAQIAGHLTDLAFEFERTTNADDTNVKSTGLLQLDNIRSDAAECLLLSNLVSNDKREIFAKTAEHLNGLAFEVEKAIAMENLKDLQEEPDLAPTIAGPISDSVQPTLSDDAAADQRQSARSFPWLASTIIALMLGGLFWASGHAGILLSSLPWRSEQEQSRFVRPAETPSKQSTIVEQLGALVGRFRLGEFLETLNGPRATETKGQSSKELFDLQQKTTESTQESVGAKRNHDAQGSLSGPRDDEAIRLRKAAETANA